MYHVMGVFEAESFVAHDKLKFEGSIFVHFHLLASWINVQFNFK